MWYARLSFQSCIFVCVEDGCCHRHKARCGERRRSELSLTKARRSSKPLFLITCRWRWKDGRYHCLHFNQAREVSAAARCVVEIAHRMHRDARSCPSFSLLFCLYRSFDVIKRMRMIRRRMKSLWHSWLRLCLFPALFARFTALCFERTEAADEHKHKIKLRFGRSLVSRFSTEYDRSSGANNDMP